MRIRILSLFVFANSQFLEHQIFNFCNGFLFDKMTLSIISFTKQFQTNEIVNSFIRVFFLTGSLHSKRTEISFDLNRNFLIWKNDNFSRKWMHPKQMHLIDIFPSLMQWQHVSVVSGNARQQETRRSGQRPVRRECVRWHTAN